MPVFRVIATMTTNLSTTIEAETEQEAFELAKTLGGDDFSEIENSSSWEINSVYETE